MNTRHFQILRKSRTTDRIVIRLLMSSNNHSNVETTRTNDVVSTAIHYDSTGAMIYIIIVLLWYSIGIIFMLGMQMRARSEAIEDSARRRTKLLIRNLRDHTNTKEILGKSTCDSLRFILNRIMSSHNDFSSISSIVHHEYR
jgi:hypothetical protein